MFSEKEIKALAIQECPNCEIPLDYDDGYLHCNNCKTGWKYSDYKNNERAYTKNPQAYTINYDREKASK